MQPNHRAHRDPGDAWVEAANGQKYWGRFGAAGLLLYDPSRDAILLQHRVSWSDHGGTWGIPGGARHQDEDAVAAALRESGEEAGVPARAVRPRFIHLLGRGGWTYTTVLAEVTDRFEPVISDAESIDLAWVPVDRVADSALHPAFGSSWQILQPLATMRISVVVDAANVVGAVPDGWWKDRLGAGRRLRDRLELLAEAGVPAGTVTGAPAGVQSAFPDWVQVVEGASRELDSAVRVQVVAAAGEGDDEIVAEASRLTHAGHAVVVVTSDAQLRRRVLDAGATRVLGAKALRDLLR